MCLSAAAGGRGCSMSEAAHALAHLGPVPRWYPTHKRVLIELVRAGRCDRDVALRHYGIAPEEYARWVKLYECDGMRGLHTKRRYAGGLRVEIPKPVAQALPIKGRKRRRKAGQR